jgi:cell division protein FtsL
MRKKIYDWFRKPFCQSKKKSKDKIRRYYAVSVPIKTIKNNLINPNEEYVIQARLPKNKDPGLPFRKLKFEKKYEWESTPYAYTSRVLKSTGKKQHYYCIPIPIHAIRTGKILSNKEYYWVIFEKIGDKNRKIENKEEEKEKLKQKLIDELGSKEELENFFKFLIYQAL